MTQEAGNPFGEWLQSTLTEKRIGVGEFHQRAKISRAAVYHYLNGKRVPDSAVLARIAAVLGISASDMPAVIPRKIGRPLRSTAA